MATVTSVTYILIKRKSQTMKMRTKMRMMKKRRREPRANDTIRMSKAAF